MRPKGTRLPGALPLRPPGPQVPQGPPVPTTCISFDQPPPLMSLNTAPSTVRIHFRFITRQHFTCVCLEQFHNGNINLDGTNNINLNLSVVAAGKDVHWS